MQIMLSLGWSTVASKALLSISGSARTLSAFPDSVKTSTMLWVVNPGERVCAAVLRTFNVSGKEHPADYNASLACITV